MSKTLTKVKITRRKFNDYRRIQFSNITNMWAVQTVVDLSDDLTREECLDIMKNYGDYEKKCGEYKEQESI